MFDYRVESEIITNPDSIKEDWVTLQKKSDCSFFQSWSWIGNWLEQIAMPLSPQLLSVYKAEQLIGLGVFVPASLHRHKVFFSRAMFLNEIPVDGNNMVIEYNGLLTARHHEAAVYRSVLEFLLQYYPAMDECFFGALSSKENVSTAMSHLREKVKLYTQETSTCRSLTLDYHGNDINAYLATISKNRRLQIKRSLRLYEQKGVLRIEAAQTAEQALTFMDGLKTLHTRRWKKSGKAGSFANEKWEQFHRALINHCFQQGEIQLLKISNPDTEVGYLYNFLWRGRVYVLQTGFVLEPDKRLMPGYVCHALAITYNKNLGMAVYDLMHGDSLYKKLLCNQTEMLYWLVLQRKKLRFLVEDTARNILHKFI